MLEQLADVDAGHPGAARRFQADVGVLVDGAGRRIGVQAASRFEVVDFVSREPSLEETFLAQYQRDPVEAAS